MSMKFNATYEIVSPERAIVTLLDAQGEWAGYFRVDKPRSMPLYEAAFFRAEQEAAVKGGTLETFRPEKAA